MILTSVDLGLMANHLPKHEGVINKLKHYRSVTENTILAQVINEQIRIMRSHVRIMLQLMDPSQHGAEALTPVRHIVDTIKVHELKKLDKPDYKDIALEARATAQFMAIDNFVSAIEMKVPTVKHIHVDMALQQVRIAGQYSQIINKMGWEHPPVAAPQEQIWTIQQFKHVLKE